MYKSQRLRRILDLLGEMGFCSTQDLAAHLGVSQTTIYRDLNELEAAGAIRKQYGGVTLATPAPDRYVSHIDFDVRQAKNLDEKRAIADRATDLIENGDSLFLDASSTSLVLAQRLLQKHKRELTIITNSPRVVLLLRDEPEYRTICTGGTYLKRFDSLVGLPAEGFIGNLAADKFIFSVLGISTQGCTDSEQAEVSIKQLMLARSRTVILLADHSKFSQFATFKVADPPEIDILVTDWYVSDESLTPFLEVGVSVVRADMKDT